MQIMYFAWWYKFKEQRSFCTLETFENVVERVLVQQCFFELSSTKSR
jgi:hypothetical protein